MSAVHSQCPSGAMTVISANVEGLSANKASIQSELCKIQYCHCLCLQETHRVKDHARPKIPGMTLVAERPHNKHGSSVFVRDGMKVNSTSVCEEENVELITVERPGVFVHFLVKPPPEPFLLPPLGQRIKPHIVIGYFNSHSTLWGYTTMDSDGEAVEQWADSKRLSLIHNAKLSKSFNSELWKKGYNPDLIFVSSNILDMCEKSVLDPIPRTQHRHICVTVHPVIVPQPTASRRRFNLRTAIWDDFSTAFDEAIKEVEPIPENYDRFICLVRVVSRRHIPRGVGQTTYLVSRKSNSAYMKHTRNSTHATLLPKEPWRLETSCLTQWKKKRRRDGNMSSHRLIWLITVARPGRQSRSYQTTLPLQTIRVWSTPTKLLTILSSMAKERCQQSLSALHYQL